MKKILLCGILAMAAGTMAFAQQWPDGFSVSGQVRTGLRADFFGGDLYDGRDARDTSFFSFWHDDSGNRTQLDMKYEQDNFGLRLVPRWTFYDSGTAEINLAYGWFGFMNNMVVVSAGRLNDDPWFSPTPEDVRYSGGNGVRVEVKPIEGLNVGWILGHGINGVQGNSVIDDNARLHNLRDLFASSSFGAKYESEMFTVAAGLDLISNNSFSGLPTERPTTGIGFGGRADPMNAFLTSGAGGAAAGGTAFKFGEGTVGYDDVAIEAYLGAEVKPMGDALTIQVGAKAGNLDYVSNYGWLHLNEKIAYDVGGIVPRIEMHQKLDLRDKDNQGYVDPVGDTSDTTPVYMEFIPGADINNLVDNARIYVEVPVKLWDKVFEIGVKPGMEYSFGPGLSINCYYNLLLTTNSYKDNATTGLSAPKDAMRNSVQISFGWSF